MSETVDPAVVRARLARACRAGDAVAEAAARRELAVVKFVRVVDEVRRSGVRLSVEQGELVCGAVAGVVEGSAAAVPHGRVSVHGPVVPLRPVPEPRPVTEW